MLEITGVCWGGAINKLIGVVVVKVLRPSVPGVCKRVWYLDESTGRGFRNRAIVWNGGADVARSTGLACVPTKRLKKSVHPTRIAFINTQRRRDYIARLSFCLVGVEHHCSDSPIRMEKDLSVANAAMAHIVVATAATCHETSAAADKAVANCFVF